MKTPLRTRFPRLALAAACVLVAAILGSQPAPRETVGPLPGGGFLLTPHDPDFEKAMAVARRGMKRYHNALAELAK